MPLGGCQAEMQFCCSKGCVRCWRCLRHAGRLIGSLPQNPFPSVMVRPQQKRILG